jgi:LPS sulfotransferase NodH
MSRLQKRFVVLAAPRSGSNMLCAMLGSHPDILCHHEIFNPKGVRLALELRNFDVSLGTMAERDGAPLEFLERVWAHNLGHACVGFKLTHRQNEAVYRHLLANTSIAKVILRRQNRIKVHVSRRISEQLAEWEVYRSQDLRRDRPRIKLDVAALRDEIAFDDAYYAEILRALQSGGHRGILTHYENLTSAAEQYRILEFLGVQPSAGGLEIRSIKQNSRNLRDLVLNYDEVLAVLAGTDLEAELTDTEN